MASADIYVKITKMMVGSLDNSHNMIISAACLALAELGRYIITGFVYSTHSTCVLSGLDRCPSRLARSRTSLRPTPSLP